MVEKLIRGCPEIGTIYLLMRQKKGKTIQERLNEITRSAVIYLNLIIFLDPILSFKSNLETTFFITLQMFEPLKKINPDFPKKIVPVSGDVGHPRLGLSAADYALLIKEVFLQKISMKLNRALCSQE